MRRHVNVYLFQAVTRSCIRKTGSAAAPHRSLWLADGEQWPIDGIPPNAAHSPSASAINTPFFSNGRMLEEAQLPSVEELHKRLPDVAAVAEQLRSGSFLNTSSGDTRSEEDE